MFQARTIGRVEWRRITDLSQQPRLVTGSVERCEVVQGKYGSSWFVSALSVLAGARKLWEKVVIDYDHQEWSHENASESYTGIFKFKFWRFGKWRQVLVDDLIPTKDGVPIFNHSKDKDEWWPVLLEKAYAK